MHCINLRRPPSRLGHSQANLSSSNSDATRQYSSKLDTALAAPSVGVRRGFTARCGPRGCWRGTSSRATMCSTPSVRNIWWNIPTCSTHGPTWTLEGQACRGERTDDKPRGEWSSLRLSRGAKEEDDSQPTHERIQCQAVWLRRTRTRLDNV